MGGTITVGEGLTVTQTTLVVSTAPPQPVICALKQALAVRLPVVKGTVVAPAIFVQGPPVAGADCHCTTPC